MEKKAIFEAVRAIIANDFAPRFAAQSQQPVIERDTRLWADLRLDNQDVREICREIASRHGAGIDVNDFVDAKATVGQLADCLADKIL